MPETWPHLALIICFAVLELVSNYQDWKKQTFSKPLLTFFSNANYLSVFL